MSLVRFPSIVLFLLLFSVQAVGESKGEWIEVKSTKKLTIFNRGRPGSDIKEVRAVGILECAPWLCKNVVDRVDKYPKFMPYTKEARIIKTTDTYMLSYQYLDMPFISDRDYTIKIRDKTYVDKSGTIIYKKAWEPANALGPKVKDGVVRLVVNEGYWEFKPINGGAQSKATYYLYTDPGGALPAFLINKANTSAIPNLFEAVEKTSRDPFYQSFKPKGPSGASSSKSPATPTVP